MEAQGVTFFSDSPPPCWDLEHTFFPGRQVQYMGGPCSFHSPLLRYGSKSRRTVAQAVTERRGASFSAVPGRAGDMRDWVGTVALPSRGASPSHVSVPACKLQRVELTASTKTGRRLGRIPLASHCATRTVRTDEKRYWRARTPRAGHAFPTPGSPRCRGFFFCIQCPFWKMERASSSPCCDRPVKFARGRRKKLPVWICKESKRQTPQLEPPAIEQIGSLWIMIRLRPFEGFHLSPFMYPKPSPSQPRGFPPASSLTSASSSSTL